MGLFDFMDARKTVPKWADTWFRTIKRENGSASDEEIAQTGLMMRYSSVANERLKFYVSIRVASVKTIHDLCYVVVEAECYGMPDPMVILQSSMDALTRPDQPNPLRDAHAIIDQTLMRLGYPTPN